MTSTASDLLAADPASPGAAARAHQALLRLPSHERDAISMTLYQGMSCRLVASALRVPEGSVRSWIRSGLGRISRELFTDPVVAPIVDPVLGSVVGPAVGPA